MLHEHTEIFQVGQKSQIKIKWANNGNQEMDFAASDDDADGFIDHVSWVSKPRNKNYSF
jgi:hypothetical protein